MKKIFAGLIICASGALSAQVVQNLNSIGAYSNDLNAGSARYIGMGGSMGALGGDLSSTEQNPAGLAVAITSDVNVTMGISSFKNESKFGQTHNSKDNAFNFQNFAGTFVFHNDAGPWNRFSIGLKYSEESLDNWINLGRNDKITGTFLTNENPDEYTTYIMDGYQDLVEGYKSKTTLDFGASYKDQLYLGLGFNFHDVRYNNYVVFDEDTNGSVFRYDLNGTPYATRATGISLSAGVIGKIQDNFRLGLAYHSPTWYSNIEENYYADLQLGENNFKYDYYYSEYDRNSNNRLVASAAWVFGKSLALNADYTYHMNGSTQFKPKRSFNETNQFIDDQIKNSSEIRLGGEYRIDKFRLRAGYNYVETPFEEANLVSDLGYGVVNNNHFSNIIQGDVNRFSFGAGYDFGGFYLDAAYQFQNQKYNYVFGNADYIDYDSGENTVYYATLPMNADHNYVAEIKNKKGLFLLTMGWQF
ncbi:MAG TPA: hypothetical protein VL022_03685 [Moheibacter sp.]|nr:hypothetical protein [Moheibacter sp.]